jgi:hypothetical protein
MSNRERNKGANTPLKQLDLVRLWGSPIAGSTRESRTTAVVDHRRQTCIFLGTGGLPLSSRKFGDPRPQDF